MATNKIDNKLSIALDQMIEYVVNKRRQRKGGINGRLSEESINNWTDSFAFRALTAFTLHEICELETDNDSMNSHTECLPNRQDLDDDDLSMILKNLRQENLFTLTNVEFRKVRSGLVIHDDIISNITSLYEGGEKALTTFINERLIKKVVPVDAALKTIRLLKLAQADTYLPQNSSQKKTESSNSAHVKDFNNLAKVADDEISRIMIIAEQRNIKTLSQLFASVPFSLCDTVNRNAIVISGSCPSETKSQSNIQTVQEYAVQLLDKNIRNLLTRHRRADVVFDSAESKTNKMFIKRYENDANKCVYRLKGDDKLQYSFSNFFQANRATLAACMKECWMRLKSIDRLPKGLLLVVGDSDEETIKLQKGYAPTTDYTVESTQTEATRHLILHINAIILDQEQKSVLIESHDTDIVLLAVAFNSSIFSIISWLDYLIHIDKKANSESY
ncbi:unnamed protein product [Rotaria magnacalcarata]|uniref:Uncharacterized protein n=2 Tax=Rotaria magnacalcarata TaxID=392030 RepID=A0A816UMD1_9BILA|nr:unnamed protein product [Rotaria magnacalcarata]